ncbi:hypothetical protein [Streptomyces sp. NL15-2K]|uniref:SCO2400 family protein n=1 Tax=Streptomyces sp. NL15-2K TaxID=376149 RepID=UPI000F582361|nr:MULTISPECIES: hypothetical protein [Actinomycetes]WKX10910.1 hypothetical protein Q4V64_26755 [Kutzneria buriramensis]GCB47527.1 flagellar hook-length control protein fliK [Streptomyces sp. NL15-2K]
MDYCSTCRRHLNGALVCPGCGAYAPDIAPGLVDGHPVPGPATAASTGTAAWAVTSSDAPREAPPVDPAIDESGHATPAPQGRAARRRQQARWKKTQRRALVATAVALVGGGLTVLSMDRQSTDKTQAATAPGITGMGGAEETTDQHLRPESTPPATRGTSRTSPEQATAADDQRRRPAPASTPTTTPPNTRPDAAAVPRTPVIPQQRNTTQTSTSVSAGSATDQTGTSTGTSTGSGSDSGTAAQPTPAPPAAGDNSGSDSGSSQTSPDPATTSPSSPQLCVLVICLG